MMTFKDIFKKSFLEGWTSNEIGIKSICMALLITAFLGFYIFMAYRVMTRKTFYSKNFAISLVGVSLITAAIIMTIQSSIVISLGMVGALSIVRFRTAIKDPMDLMFLFWGISDGIICGAGLAEFAVILSLFLTVGFFILDKFPIAKAPMILVLNSTNHEIESSVLPIIEKYCQHYNVKSRNISSTTFDLTFEVRTNKGNELIKELIQVNGTTYASLLSHDGEVTF